MRQMQYTAVQMGETFHHDTNLWGHEGGIPTLVNLVCRIPQLQPQTTTS